MGQTRTLRASTAVGGGRASDWQVRAQKGCRVWALAPPPRPHRARPRKLVRKILTSIQAAGRCSPAHDRGDGPNDGPDPRVGDADPLQRGVATGVQENVEDPQGPREGVHPPGQERNSGNSTASGEGHS